METRGYVYIASPVTEHGEKDGWMAPWMLAVPSCVMCDLQELRAPGVSCLHADMSGRASKTRSCWV